MVRSLHALVSTFEEATRKRKLSTMLYEDIDALSAIAALPEKERDLVEQLNQRIKEEPNYPLPEGFTKVKEKKTIYSYRVPEEIAPHLGEAKVVCVELIDELLNNAFGIHILEPVVTFQEQQAVRPAFTKSVGKKPRQAEAVGIMNKADARAAPSSRQTNRSNLPKIGQESVRQPKPAPAAVIPKVEPVTLQTLPKTYHSKIN